MVKLLLGRHMIETLSVIQLDRELFSMRDQAFREKIINCHAQHTTWRREIITHDEIVLCKGDT